MDKLIFTIIAIGILVGQTVQVPIAGTDAPLLDLAVVAVLIIGAVPLLQKRATLSKHSLRFFLPLGLFAIALVLSFGAAIPHLEAREAVLSGLYLARLLGYLCVPLLVGLYFSPAKMSEYIKWFVWLGLGVLTLGMLQLAIFPDFGIFEYLGWDPHQGRLLSTFLDPNFVGIWLSFGAGLCTLLLLSREWRKDWAGGVIGLGLFVASTLLTFSRSALASLVAVLFVVVLIKRWRLVWVMAISLVLLIAVSPRLQDRLAGIWQIDATVGYRLESWQAGVQTWFTHPALGVGYNTLAYRRYEGALPGTTKLVSRAATGYDSSLLTIAATTGTVGLIAFIFLIFSGVRLAYRITRASQQRLFSPLFLAMTAGLALSSWFVNAWLYGPILLTWLIVFALSIKEADE